MPATISTEIERPNMPGMGGPTWVDVTVDPGVKRRAVRRQILLVIDRSASMCGPKLQSAREGAKRVLGLLGPDDHVGVISFDSAVDVALEPTRVGDLDPFEAVERIDDVAVGGGTNIYSAVEAARGRFEDLPSDATTVRRILLLTDGRDNLRESDEFTELARDVDQAGIRIMAAGLGDRYSAETVRTLGVASGGQWSHLEDASDVHGFFEEKLRAAGDVVAPDATLELDLAEGVEVTDIYRARPQTQEADVEWTDDTASVRLSDLCERERQTIKFRMIAPERAVGTTEDLVDLKLRAAGERATGTVAVRYSDENERLADRATNVWTESKETVIRARASEGQIEDAATELETLAVTIDDRETLADIEEVVTTVQRGGRKERYRTTIVEE